METSQELLTPSQVAKRLYVTRQTVWRWATDGLIPAVRLPGGGFRFRTADIDAILEPAHTEGVA